MTHPYENLGPHAYWKTAVAQPGAEGLTGLWQPKFKIEGDAPIVTAGSCFAQHIGKALAGRGYNWMDCEPAPPFLLGETARDHGYGVFSFRTGNIYTPNMLLQWLRMAFGGDVKKAEVWCQDDRWFDPLRPAIEPGGFASRDELFEARAATCHALRRAVSDARVFVFTLGLTESWLNADTGLEYAMCPGTAAGTFDADQHTFLNRNLRGVSRTLGTVLRLLKRRNPKLKVLLTVSPVPLTATASDKHVLTATSYSKSVLRAAAGLASDEFAMVDYFPSYEIITHPVFQGRFFEDNLRSVRPEGVETVMKHFFADQARTFGKPKMVAGTGQSDAPVLVEEDVRCEEELLDAFVA